MALCTNPWTRVDAAVVSWQSRAFLGPFFFVVWSHGKSAACVWLVLPRPAKNGSLIPRLSLTQLGALACAQLVTGGSLDAGDGTVGVT